jgi:branched-chain amino acid transport system permease protein
MDMTTVWSGLAVGAIYVLVGVAYNIVFLSTGVFNFAQAQFLMLGTFVTYTVVITLHMPFIAAIAAGLVIGAVISIVEERIAIRPLQGQGQHGELITTLGFAVLMAGIASLVWGSDPLPVPFFGSDRALTVLYGRVLPDELALIALASTMALGADLITRRTNLGLASLATAEDRIAAMLRGINVRTLSIGSFAVAGALCVAAGPLLAPKTFATFDLGDNLALKGFVALAIGGFGSHKGALVGGLITGLVEAGAARYFDVGYQNLAVFILLLGVLLVRPTGLFGERSHRAV